METFDIQERRKERGLTQEFIAEKLSVDVSTVYRWEAGLVAPSLRNSELLRDLLIRKDALLHPFVQRLLREPHALAVTDIFGVYVRTNGAFENISGLISNDLVGQTVATAFPELVELSEGKSGADIQSLATSNYEVLEIRSKSTVGISHPVVHSLEVLRQADFRTLMLHYIRLSKESSFAPGIRALRRS